MLGLLFERDSRITTSLHDERFLERGTWCRGLLSAIILALAPPGMAAKLADQLLIFWFTTICGHDETTPF